MTILVTGATGHLGNVLIRQLIALGNRVRAFALRGEDLDPLQGLPVEIVTGNVLEPNTLQFAMQGVDTVYHLASIIAIRPGDEDWVWRVNVEGTRNVIKVARDAGVRRVIYTSSIHALRRPNPGEIVDESLPFDPQSTAGIYDRTKAQASLLVQEAAEQGLNATIVCPTGIIGPYDFLGSEMGLLIRRILHSPILVMINGGFDFVDVRDVARGLIQAAEKGRVGETYLLSGHWIQLPELIRRISKVIQKPRWALLLSPRSARLLAKINIMLSQKLGYHPQLTPYSVDTVLDTFRVSSQKAKRELGYSARPLEETIADTVAWWRVMEKQQGSRSRLFWLQSSNQIPQYE